MKTILVILCISLVQVVFGQGDHIWWLARYHATKNDQCNDTLNNAITKLSEQGCLDYAPLPASTIDSRAPPGLYSSTEVKPDLYWISEGAYTALLYAPNKGKTILIDAPPTHGTNLRMKVREILKDRHLDFFIYSHHHYDHIGGSSLILQVWPNVHIVAHKKAKERIIQTNEARGQPLIPLPTRTFQTTTTVGPFKLKEAYDVHVNGNTYIYAKDMKVLMIVDVIFPGWVPYYNWGIVQNFARYLQAHDEILEFDFDIIFGGHLTRPGNRQDVIVQKEYFQDLRSALEDASSKSPSFESVAGELGNDAANIWLTFDVYLSNVLQTCYNTMVNKYTGVLAGIDILVPTHCFYMSEFLSIG